MNVISGFTRPGDDDAWRRREVDARVEEMLSSPEALLEGVARTDAARFAGPDADAELARWLADQPDRTLSSLGRALLRGERPADLAQSDEFSDFFRRGAEELGRTDGREVVRVVAENDRSLRRG